METSRPDHPLNYRVALGIVSLTPYAIPFRNIRSCRLWFLAGLALETAVRKREEEREKERESICV